MEEVIPEGEKLSDESKKSEALMRLCGYCGYGGESGINLKHPHVHVTDHRERWTSSELLPSSAVLALAHSRTVPEAP